MEAAVNRELIGAMQQSPFPPEGVFSSVENVQMVGWARRLAFPNWEESS